jgi:hypothetical protein
MPHEFQSGALSDGRPNPARPTAALNSVGRPLPGLAGDIDASPEDAGGRSLTRRVR